MSFEEWSNNKKKEKNPSSFEEWSNATRGVSKEREEEDEKKRQAYLSRQRDNDIAPVRESNKKNKVYGRDRESYQKFAEGEKEKTSLPAYRVKDDGNIEILADERDSGSAIGANYDDLSYIVGDAPDLKTEYQRLMAEQERLSLVAIECGNEIYRLERLKETDPKSVDNEKLQELKIKEKEVLRRISPIADRIDQLYKNNYDEVDGRTWFQAGALEDGFSVSGLGKGALATVLDVGGGIVEGAGDTVEGVADFILYAGAGWTKRYGFDETAQDIRDIAGKHYVQDAFADFDEWANVNENSFLGERFRPISNGVGQVGLTIATGAVGGAAGLSAKGVTALTSATQGLSSAGHGVTEAYEGNPNVSDEEAMIYGISKGAIDAGSELIFGGLGKAVNATGFSKGISSLDDIAAKALSDKIASRIANETVKRAVGNTVEFAVKSGAEGLEELIAGAMTIAAKKLTYMSEEDIYNIYKDEDLFEQFIAGALTSAFVQAPGAISSTNNKADFVTGQTVYDDKVVNKVVEDKIAEQEAKGVKLTGKEKQEIRDDVVDQMEHGQLDIDTIEETLGGDAYKAYTDYVSEQKNLKNELNELSDIKKSDLTRNQEKRIEELEGMNLDDTTKRDELRKTLDDTLKPMLNNSKLSESYREVARKGEAFTADLSKYSGKKKEAVERAIKSGVLNNTYKSHMLVETLSDMEAEKGVIFDYVNNEKLKESGFALDGVTVNGFANKSKGSITLNVQSAKAWQSVVGHEITHVLEGGVDAKVYGELRDAVYAHAESLGELESRRAAITKLYKNVENADIEAELTADLVGDYLFADKAFIDKLAGNRTLFKKIYDEIKYLYNKARGKQLTEIEKVKAAFDEAWKELDVKDLSDKAGMPIEESGKVQYSIGEIVDENNNSYGIGVKLDSTLLDNLTPEERVEMVKERVKELGGSVFTAYDKNGNVVDVTIAESSRKFKNKSGRRVPVNKDLTTKYNKNETKQEAVVLVDELIETAHYLNSDPAKHPHDWLDNNGKNDWERWTTYIEDKNNTIWEVTLNVANATNGEKILYDISPIKKVGRSGKSDTVPTDNSISPIPENVNTDFSLSSDSKGNELGIAVQKRFANSKAVDENGNLKVLYHGTASGEFYTFDKSKGSVEGDFGSGFYFTDNEYDVETNYEGGGADFENKVARLAERIETEEEIDYHEAEAIARKELYKGSNKFEVYLNIENPAVVGETILFDPDKYYEEYDRSDYDSGEDYEGDVEQLIADDIDQILWDISNNIDVYSTDGLSEVLWSAVNEGGIDIEQLKKNINDLYLEDSNGNMVGNEVTRQIIESLGYDGIIDPTVSHKWNMDMEEGTTHYIVFKPNQIKDISNQNPTDDPDIRRSLSKQGDQYAPVGSYSTPLYETALEDIATVGENVKAEAPMPADADGHPLPDEPIIEEEAEVPPLAESEEDIIKTVKERLSAKITNSAKQLEEAKLLRDWVKASYDNKIEKLQVAYDSKKNKDTKAAIGIQKRIANLKRLAADRDADMQKYISDIELRISKASERMQEPLKKDILEVRYERINKHLEADKVSLAEAIESRRAELEKALADKPSFISGKALDLYEEVRSMRKGVRVSDDLGYLLDNLDLSEGNKADSYNKLRTALLNIKNSPNQAVNANSEIESIARELLNRSYEDAVYELDDIDNQYQREIEQLEAEAEKQRTAVREEAQALRRGDVRNQKIAEIKSVLNSRGFDLDTMLDNPERQLSTLETVDTIPQRVMEKTFGYEEGQALADATVNKEAQNETKGLKWIDSITNRKEGLLAQFVKEYNIKPYSKEVVAAQIYAEGSWVDEKTGEEFAYGDAELAKDFPDVKVQNNIKALARDPRIRQFYDETLDSINVARKRNGYPEIPRLNNYYLHYREMGDFFTKFGLPFNPNDMKAKDLPTDMVGRTADLKPGQPFFTSSMHRKGKKTTYNLYEGIERYANMAKNQIYHLDDIQTFRALHYYLAERFGQAQGLENLDSLTPEEASEQIKKVYGSHLSTFAAFLDTEANILAGKTSMIDRAFSEGMVGRRILTFADALNQQTGAAMVGYNASSALTNWLPVVREFANANPVDSVKALAQTVANIATRGKFDNFREDSTVYIRRKGADRFNRKLWQKLQDPAYALMGAVDGISTEIIARTEYNKAIRNGMSEQEAHYEADKKTSRLMADRSLGQMPQMYTSRILGLFTKFQLEVRNDLDSMFYDTLQEEKVSSKDVENNLERNAKTAAKVAWRYGATAIALHMFGQAFESVAGYNPAFDIIEAISKAFGWDDDEDDEDTWRDNLGEGAMSLLEDLPYAGIFLDGGRIPISSALPDVEGIITRKDEYGNEKTLTDSFLEIAPYLLPAGGNQIKKTFHGLNMFSDEHPVSGSYTDSGNLRFPVEDTFGNRLQAAIFGQYASENAREYFDNDYAPLDEKQIQEYIDVDMPIKDYWEYREGLSDLAPLPGYKSVTLNQKGDYVGSLDLSTKQKNILINNIADDRSTPIDMKNYGRYKNFEEFDFAQRYPEKYAVLKEQGISVSDYKKNYEESAFLYTDDFSWAADNPDKYMISKIITDDVTEYKRYTSELNKITGDNTKEDKRRYIFNLGIDFGAKCVLFKSQYKKDDTYNTEIVEYINSLSGLTYDDRVAILTELGFRVTANGQIYDD